MSVEYIDLCKAAELCRRCPGMSFGRTFLNYHNGPTPSDIMFIGAETNSGEDTLIAKPMWDSPSGDNFNQLLRLADISREEVFVTNTVLHTPIDEKGKGRYASKEEQENCSVFLYGQIKLVEPKIICPLGARALEAVKRFFDHNLVLKFDVGCTFAVGPNLWMIPLYHPSPQVIMTWRTMKEQVQDYKNVKHTLDTIKELEKKNESRQR